MNVSNVTSFRNPKNELEKSIIHNNKFCRQLEFGDLGDGAKLQPSFCKGALLRQQCSFLFCLIFVSTRLQTRSDGRFSCPVL